MKPAKKVIGESYICVAFLTSKTQLLREYFNCMMIRFGILRPLFKIEAYQLSAQKIRVEKLMPDVRFKRKLVDMIKLYLKEIDCSKIYYFLHFNIFVKFLTFYNFRIFFNL